MGMSSDSLLDVYRGYVVHLIRAPAIATSLFFLLQPFYNALYHYCSPFMTDRLFVLLLLWTTHLLVYWTVNTFFFICDEYQYLQQYKLPRKKYQIPSKVLVWKTIKGAIIGQLSVDPLGFYYVVIPLWMANKPLMTYDAATISEHKLYHILLIYGKFVVCDLCNSWLFYFAHRVLHHKYLYGKVHKQHHEYTGSISLAAEYAHPIESVFANSIPTLLGALICAAHPLQFVLWLAWRLQETYESHSGYSFYDTWLHRIGLTNADSALFHDFHHSKNVGNYGGIHSDALFGTDKGWNEWYKKWRKSRVQ